VIKKRQAGFTIIELLIATAVFSVILLVCAFALLQIGRTYYKGVTSTKVQETARSIMDDISRGIQFSGDPIAPTSSNPPQTYMFCVGSQRYSVKTNQQVIDTSPDSARHQGYHALVIDTVAGCNSGSGSQNLDAQTVSGRELVSPNMRLAKLTVTDVGANNLYQINIRVVYGDDEVLDDTFTNCRSERAGTQFCAVSELTTTVQKRL
jgi:prepilin-type N-terminal cleavage/methylation domain-containing protein